MMNSRVDELSRLRLSDQVATALLRSIVSGDLAGGQQLPTELELCEQFGISRTVVREAVRMLVSRGLVEVKQGKGMTVAPPSAWDPLDTEIERVRFERGDFGSPWHELREARSAYGMGVAALAAAKRDAADLAALSEALGRMRSAARDGDLQSYRSANVEFHMRLARATHNQVLERILRPVHALLMAGGVRPPSHVDRMLVMLARHERLYRAIEAGDQQEAAEALVTVYSDTTRVGATPSVPEAGPNGDKPTAASSA